MLVVANMRPETLERWSPIIFGMAVLLLVAVLLFGTVGKGARRWLSLAGFRFQPSEFMKLALPMALAWFFARDSLPPRLWRFGVAVLAIALPAALIARQPDLGTAVLVATGGLALLFIAGLKWRIIVPLLAGAVVAAPIVYFRFLHEYQRSRIDVLLDPQSDPLGTGYQTIQSMIAVGSGGFYGKGWLNSSQAHLEYLPESSTDFVFAVFAEEFGLIGSLVLIGLYLFIIAPRLSHRLSGPRQLLAPARRRRHPDRVPEFLRQHRHGAGGAAGGGRAVAGAEFRRHLPAHLPGRLRRVDEHPDPPADSRIGR